ncbi:RNA polymerase sigma-70 factor [Chitinophaga sp. MM2321]|uniref:RNA polymerase sigma-70 factor n=1 Tax=Chitinophaga sp. MM2321 TaxID=3137178 RepID=UPI0032D579EC
MVRKGDQAAFAEIYHKYAAELFQYAGKVLKDSTAAEDIVQELFAGLWKSREQLHIHTSLRAYIYAANRNLLLKVIRKREKESHLFNQLEYRVTYAPDPENLLHNKELGIRISLLAAGLPDKCREIYRLSREQHLSNKEISARLGITEKTVENQLTIALRKLRKGMGYVLVVFLHLLPV